ncbi:MAG TPA: hypothetical protein VF352_00750, partial [Anaerolineales bacterium]
MKPKKPPAFKERLGVLLHSIRFRLVLWFTAILAVILFAFSAFLFYTQSRTLQEEAIHEIDRRVTGLAENVQTALRQGSEPISIPNGLLRDTDVFILLSPDGQALASQGPIPAQEAIQIVSAGLQTAPRTNESP